jgi:purine-cytosine permease-like protein
MNTILTGITNWKTTLTVIIGAIAYLVAIFGIQVTPEVQQALIVVVLFFVGLFAKDGNTSVR